MKSIRLLWLSVLLSLSFWAAAPAAQVEPAARSGAGKPWAPDDIILAESASQWAVSPDGRRAVWVKSNMDKDKNGPVSNLFLTDLESGKETQLTRGSESYSQPAWSPNGEGIAFLSTRPLPQAKADSKAEDKGPQLWLISLLGGEPYPLTESARGLSRFKWLDPESIVFSAQEDPTLWEQEREKLKDDTKTVDDVAHEPPVRLCLLKVRDKKVVRLTDNADRISHWDVTPDGRLAVTVHQESLSFEWDQKILPRTCLTDLRDGSRREVFEVLPIDWTVKGPFLGASSARRL